MGGSSSPSARVALVGHRGARGLWPENTVPGFLGALAAGANVLELDLHLAQDGVPVVCHDPDLPFGGRRVPVSSRPASFWAGVDVGSMVDPRFPERIPVAATVPSLATVLSAVRGSGQDPGWLLELKRNPGAAGSTGPDPEAFAAAVAGDVRNAGLVHRSVVISFDTALLESAHREGLATGLLLEPGTPGGPEELVARLDHRPTSLGPHHSLVDAAFLGAARREGLRVIPWTVNEPDRMERLLRLGVDGVTTDRPDLAAQVFDRVLGDGWVRVAS